MLIDDTASLVALRQLPLSNDLAAACSRYCESIKSAGVTHTTSSDAAIGIRPRSPHGVRRCGDALPASAAPPTANTHAVTAGISQSQSTPAWTAHARTAANSAA